MKTTPNGILVDLVRSMSGVEAQNRLMGMTDREIAVSMMYMEDTDRDYLLNLLAPAKARRVEEERRMHRRLNIRYDQYLKTVENVIRKMQGRGGADRFRSYIRPRRG